MSKKKSITLMAIALMAITSAYAADYNAITHLIILNNVQISGNPNLSATLTPSDGAGIHAGQVWSLSTSNATGAQDAQYTSDGKLYLPNLVQDAFITYNASLLLTNVVPLEFTVLDITTTSFSNGAETKVVFNQGAKGDAGLKGDTGLQGIDGAAGVIGVTGTQGLQGLTGAVGATGLKGDTGSQGIDGAAGVIGATGTQGLQGLTGAIGAVGATGLKGDTGLQGIDGAAGVIGATGTQGLQGLTGAIGAVGATGLKGDTGLQGIDGAAGVIGATGTQGLQGLTGATGATGLKGDTGSQGIDGAAGVIGATGTQGLQGLTGDSGLTTSVNGVTQVSGAISLTKADFSDLNNLNNTSDANKPVSTATQTQLDLKAPLVSPTFTGIPTAPSATQGTNTTQLATTAFVAAAVAASTHAIGDVFGGGKVFYVTTDGKHGLVAATQDQSVSVIWYDAIDVISNPANHDVAGKMFTDWRLPTKFELNLLYVQRGLVGGFVNNLYWSSAEPSAANAWCQDFGTSSQYSVGKSALLLLRAVRAF
ncbi:MAG: DUF1566 domain-containing protein [Methylococcales bacterium]|nr:DUF1566 domain-containing protein [Methylococcales bacterium]